MNDTNDKRKRVELYLSNNNFIFIKEQVSSTEIFTYNGFIIKDHYDSIEIYDIIKHRIYPLILDCILKIAPSEREGISEEQAREILKREYKE